MPFGGEILIKIRAYVAARAIANMMVRTILDLDKENELGGDLRKITAEQFQEFLRKKKKEVGNMSPEEVQEFVNFRLEGLPPDRKRRLRDIMKALIKAGVSEKSG